VKRGRYLMSCIPCPCSNSARDLSISGMVCSGRSSFFNLLPPPKNSKARHIPQPCRTPRSSHDPHVMHAANTPGHKHTCIPRRLGALGFVWHVLVADLCSCTRRPGLATFLLVANRTHARPVRGGTPRFFPRVQCPWCAPSIGATHHTRSWAQTHVSHRRFFGGWGSSHSALLSPTFDRPPCTILEAFTSLS